MGTRQASGAAAAMRPLPNGPPPADLFSSFPPKRLQLLDGPARVLSLAELKQDWHGLHEELNPE